MLQTIVDERRAHRRDDVAIKAKKDMLDALLEVEDDNGKQMTDEEIIDLLVMYLNAGHESTGHMMMWTTLLLHQHSECLQKAKVIASHLIIQIFSKQQAFLSIYGRNLNPIWHEHMHI